MPLDVEKYLDKKEDKQQNFKNEKPFLISLFIDIFTIKFINKEEAKLAIEKLFKSGISIISFLIAFDIMYSAFSHSEPFYGYIILLIFGALIYCIKKWYSRIASTTFFVILIILLLGLISLLSENKIKSSWAYEILFFIPLLYLSYKMLKATFLIQKKQIQVNDIGISVNVANTTISDNKKQINYKKGFKRIFKALGYIFFIFLGLLIGSETSFYTSVIGAICGFFLFKYLLIGINWIIQGFKED